ncbi:MAG: PAS domain-containing sensor histidine kinase, partial [Pseudomonas sp.]|nr:PAS domain-containing sensor histidine kinase [Pseudomonas sp.]
MAKSAKQSGAGRAAVGQELQELVRLAGEGVGRHELADALLRLTRSRPEVIQAYYLAWQAAAGTYAELGSVERLPPGQGDPLTASDAELHAQLTARGELGLAELRRLPCWLAGRLRRAGIRQGVALALELTPDEPGLLLLELEEPGSGLAGWLAQLLGAVLLLARQQLRPSPLLDADGEPSLLLDGDGRLLDRNRAALQLQQDCGVTGAGALLPVNHTPLLHACLQQRRAIGPVSVEVAGRILLWQFVPEPASGRVRARGRDASEQIRSEREAARASRLYRLITENTTDLISRHTPGG